MAQQPAVTASVPFNFTVGDKTLPAGDYDITSPSSGMIEVQDRGRRHSVRIVTIPGAQASGRQNSLVFDKYGDRYFLHQVLCPDLPSLAANVPASKPEKKAQQQEAELGIPQLVYLAAR